VTARNIPTQIRFVNNLPTGASTNVLAWKYSTDQTLHWADPLGILDGAPETNKCAEQGGVPLYLSACAQNYTGPVPAVVHLHGGEVPPQLDGGPDSWFTSDGLKGHAYYSKNGADTGEAIYRYPNSQEAANIWFHDHALGITRLNVYAGLAGGYVITDPTLDNPNNPGPANLPGPIVPLVIQDRMFDTNGQLFFPADSAGGLLWSPNPEHPYWVPEFVGDTIVVNGKTWPFLSVQAKRYRFLFLNGSNARTYELALINQVTGTNGPAIYVIGTDGGYLDAPVKIDPALGGKLTIMPGERYDVIIDFAGFGGTNLIIRNTGRTPYPKGAPPNGSTLGRIIQFRVQQGAVADSSFNPAVAGATIRQAGNQMVRLPGTPKNPTITPGAAGGNVQKFRQLTLNEVLAPPVNATDPVTGTPLTPYPGGPIEILVNNTKWTGQSPRTYNDFEPVTFGNSEVYYYSELPKEGETELWEIINLTADAHPMHLHAVQFQIVNRQNFNFNKYNGGYNASFPTVDKNTYPKFAACTGAVYCPGFGPPLNYNTGAGLHLTYNQPILGGNPDVTPWVQGAPIPPALQEQGWKDTVVVPPGMVTRLMVRWAPTDLLATTPPTVANFPFTPDGGHGYVWHCHIIDHEDNEMMRPTSIIALGSVANPVDPAPDRTYKQGTDY
jgi:FtsP/CotA-like multicopper oxidase with cupredoxin domain